MSGKISARDASLLSAVLLAVVLVYARMASVSFCGYDDFHELARAAFEFSPVPSRVVTTPHDGFKYRPLNRAVTLWSWRLAGFHAPPYRVRNIFMHLVCVSVLYVLGVWLIGSRIVAASAALLFGVHPLANQSVNGAVWTNTMAHAAGFVSTVMLFAALTGRAQARRVAATGALAGIVGVLLYESTIVFFIFPWVFLAVAPERSRRGDRCVVLGCQIVVLSLYGALRAVAVPETYALALAGTSGVRQIGFNSLLYLAALLNPIDPVFAHEVFGTALPPLVNVSDLLDRARRHLPAVVTILAAVTVLAGLAGSVARARWRSGTWRAGQSGGDLRALLGALGTAMLVPLVPVLLLTDHASETYMYLPVAFEMMLSCVVGWWIVGPSRMWSFGMLVLLVAGYLACATSMRNALVARCGETAARIQSETPSDDTRVAQILFANVPDEEQTTRYGLYGYRGIDTIGNGAMADRGVSAALQLQHDDWKRSAKVVSAAELDAECTSGNRDVLPLWVHQDGRVQACRR